MSDTTNAKIRALGEELCKVADERFGYMYGLEILLETIGLEAEADTLIALAKARRMEEFKALVTGHLFIKR